MYLTSLALAWKKFIPKPIAPNKVQILTQVLPLHSHTVYLFVLLKYLRLSRCILSSHLFSKRFCLILISSLWKERCFWTSEVFWHSPAQKKWGIMQVSWQLLRQHEQKAAIFVLIWYPPQTNWPKTPREKCR